METSQREPFLVWSCGEDGLVLEHDIRQPKGECSRVVVAYAEATAGFSVAPTAVKAGDKKKKGSRAPKRYLAGLEAKCLAVNQIRTEYLAVGANDPFARVYDRRALRFRQVPERSASSTSSSTLERFRLLRLAYV